MPDEACQTGESTGSFQNLTLNSLIFYRGHLWFGGTLSCGFPSGAIALHLYGLAVVDRHLRRRLIATSSACGSACTGTS